MIQLLRGEDSCIARGDEDDFICAKCGQKVTDGYACNFRENVRFTKEGIEYDASTRVFCQDCQIKMNEEELYNGERSDGKDPLNDRYCRCMRKIGEHLHVRFIKD